MSQDTDNDEEFYYHILHALCMLVEEHGVEKVLGDLERIQQNYTNPKE